MHVDGREKSGSGTLVRVAVALSALTGRPLHVSHARARRAKPGLRPQHVAAVRACAELCGGRTRGVEVDASAFEFLPGAAIPGGAYEWDIGTAGSATMLALGLLPVACLAEAPVRARIRGGVFQDFAPSPYLIARVLSPLLARMGVRVEVELCRPGYVPGGAGLIELRVAPARGPLAPLELTQPGSPGAVRGVALSSHLAERRVSERMAKACEVPLRQAGLSCRIDRVDDSSAAQPGAGLAVWTSSSSGCLYGADRAGAPRRSSEAIGRYVARSLLEDLRSGATTDRHVADQLVPFAALAAGTSCWLVPGRSEHLESNLWLAERFGARVRHRERRVEIDGLGLQR